jgi:hypothetical protein
MYESALKHGPDPPTAGFFQPTPPGSPDHHIERCVVECPLDMKENYNVTYTNLTAVLTNVITLIT